MNLVFTFFVLATLTNACYGLTAGDKKQVEKVKQTGLNSLLKRGMFNMGYGGGDSLADGGDSKSYDSGSYSSLDGSYGYGGGLGSGGAGLGNYDSGYGAGLGNYGAGSSGGGYGGLGDYGEYFGGSHGSLGSYSDGVVGANDLGYGYGGIGALVYDDLAVPGPDVPILPPPLPIPPRPIPLPPPVLPIPPPIQAQVVTPVQTVLGNPGVNKNMVPLGLQNFGLALPGPQTIPVYGTGVGYGAAGAFYNKFDFVTLGLSRAGPRTNSVTGGLGYLSAAEARAASNDPNYKKATADGGNPFLVIDVGMFGGVITPGVDRAAREEAAFAKTNINNGFFDQVVRVLRMGDLIATEKL
jgi:hypothetical protein